MNLYFYFDRTERPKFDYGHIFLQIPLKKPLLILGPIYLQNTLLKPRFKTRFLFSRSEFLSAVSRSEEIESVFL